MQTMGLGATRCLSKKNTVAGGKGDVGNEVQKYQTGLTENRTLSTKQKHTDVVRLYASSEAVLH